MHDILQKRYAEKAKEYLVCISAGDVLQNLQRHGKRSGMQGLPSKHSACISISLLPFQLNV